MGSSDVEAPASATVPRPGSAAPTRRWLRWSIIGALVLLLLLAVATVGVGYYFSDVLLKVENSTSYDLTVKSVDGTKVVLDRTDSTELPSVQALEWDGGRAILSADVTVDGDTVVRTVDSVVNGTLAAGLAITVDTRVFGGNPRSARQLSFEDVSIAGELGAMPAWYVPPADAQTAKTWVIAVHGYAASRTETLRVLPIIAAAGLPTLAISYRNDVGAPASEDNFYHLGDTEWRDVQSAIQYARTKGATGVVLYAWSMGGALSMTALRRMPAADAGLVKGVVMDSGNFDWSAILDYQASQRGLPGFITSTAKQIIEWRASLSLGDLDQVPYAPDLKVPMLVFVDHSDKTVPNKPAVDFARARPDLVTLVETHGGGHTGSWNTGPDAYAAAVDKYLAQVS